MSLQWHVQGLVCWYFFLFTLCSSGGLQALLACIMAGMDQWDSYVAPQLQFIKVVVISFVTQWHVPMVLATMVIPQLQPLDKVIDGPVVRFVLFFSCRSHARCVQRQMLGYVSQLQFINRVVYTPVVEQSFMPMALPFSRPSPVAVLTVVDVLVVSVVRVPQLPFVRTQLFSHSCSSWRKSWR